MPTPDSDHPRVRSDRTQIHGGYLWFSVPLTEKEWERLSRKYPSELTHHGFRFSTIRQALGLSPVPHKFVSWLKARRSQQKPL